MNINATLFGQMITFALFVWLVMRFVWPPIIEALETRRIRVAEGLAAAERGTHALEEAKMAVDHMRQKAREEHMHLLAEAKAQTEALIAQAKKQAEVEAEAVHERAQQELAVMLEQARTTLRQSVGGLVVQAASRVLEREVAPQDHQTLIDNLVKGL